MVHSHNSNESTGQSWLMIVIMAVVNHSNMDITRIISQTFGSAFNPACNHPEIGGWFMTLFYPH